MFFGPVFPTRQMSASGALGLFRDRLRLATQFDYRGGHKISRLSEANRCGSPANCRGLNDPHAPFADQANAIAANSTRLGNVPTGFYEDGAFTRWRELSATVEIPQQVARAVRLQGISFTASARNLYVFTKYRGVDPEVQANPGVASVEGFRESGTMPPARYWLLRANIAF